MKRMVRRPTSHQRQSFSKASIDLSALAHRPFGKCKRTLPSGSPKTRSIFLCPVATLASRRRLYFRFAGYSLVLGSGILAASLDLPNCVYAVSRQNPACPRLLA